MREMRAVFRRSQELISDCECSVASLAAQLALRVDPGYAPRAPGQARGMEGLPEERGGPGWRRDGPGAKTGSAVA